MYLSQDKTMAKTNGVLKPSSKAIRKSYNLGNQYRKQEEDIESN